MTYRVDGFQEIVDAVRRGHAVLVRRTRVEVADGIVVFDTAAPGDDGVAAILSFDIGTARFVLQDPADPHAQVALTPRRLQRYVDAPDRSCGLALGA